MLEAVVGLLVRLGRNTRVVGFVRRIILVISSFLRVEAAGPHVLVDPSTGEVGFAWRGDCLRSVDMHRRLVRAASHACS